MLTNYIKIAIRQLLKNKTFSLINILGLSVGVACCTLLALFIQDEFSYEKHFNDHERVYRMYTTFTIEGKTDNFPRTSPPIAMALPDLLPEIETATRMIEPPEVEQHLIRYNGETYYEKKGVIVDSTFFDIFNYDFVEGDPATALDEPATVVVTEELYRKIFRDKNGIDELLIINSGRTVDTFRVTGVLKKPKGKSHLNASFYLCMNSDGFGGYVLRSPEAQTWAWNNFVSGYLKLRPGTDAADVEAKLPALLEARAGADLKAAGMVKVLRLQPLDDIRLYSDFTDAFGDVGQGSITYIYILGSIGIFILLIACINFMNLTTAKSAQRSGEVGIRKSMGAQRSALIRQFLGESYTIVAVSLVLAAVLITLVLPLVNHLTQKELAVGGSNAWMVIGALVGVGLITGLLAGSYPAFFLSSFAPARVLKNKSLTGDGSSLLRKGLVVFQFVITITLISSIFVIQQQFTYIQSASLGFSDEAVLMVPLRSRETTDAYPGLRDAFRNISAVKEVTAASSLPSTPLFQDFGVFPEGSAPDKAVLHRFIQVDEKYFDVLDIKLLKGRDFTRPIDTFSYFGDSTMTVINKVIVNEASLKVFGIDLETAIGTRMFSEYGDFRRTYEIIGVANDFHQFSLHQEIVPLIFGTPVPNRYGFLAAKVDGGDYQAVTESMKAIWDERVPGIPFEVQPLGDSVSKQYEADNRMNTMLTLSTALAIIISCMGLYGLSIFVAERRIKEIGIRKVLGASVPGIVGMLSRDFIKLVIIAFVVAVPIGYYLMEKWLEGFAYRISLGVTVFVLSGLAAFLIAWFTVGFESIKAAVGNPVKALRSE
jgi:putative ABC transport system permease protein